MVYFILEQNSFKVIRSITISDQPAEKVPKELFCLAAAKLASQKAQWERTPKS